MKGKSNTESDSDNIEIQLNTKVFMKSKTLMPSFFMEPYFT